MNGWIGTHLDYHVYTLKVWSLGSRYWTEYPFCKIRIIMFQRFFQSFKYISFFGKILERFERTFDENIPISAKFYNLGFVQI